MSICGQESRAQWDILIGSDWQPEDTQRQRLVYHKVATLYGIPCFNLREMGHQVNIMLYLKRIEIKWEVIFS